jgi:glycosyltransferase involved in cell wall biosynthesis
MTEPLRIAVDALTVKREQGGNRTYTTGAVAALAGLPHTQVDVFVMADDQNDWGSANVRHVGFDSLNPWRRLAWREARLPDYIRSTRADVLFVPAPEALQRSPVPQTVVIHDVGPLVAPALYGLPRFVRYAASMRSTIQRASRVICVSEATKLDVVRAVGCDPSKIAVVGQGTPWDSEARSDLGRKNAGGDPYVLCVGSALRHKNLGILADAFATRGVGEPPIRLVLVGPDYQRDAQQTDRESLRGPAIEHRGFVSRSELQDLYAGAECLAFPSLHEGFGIPLLEAMHHQVPIVASDISALREIARDAALFVSSPTEPTAWREAIDRLRSTPTLAAQLVANGDVRLADFAWPNLADSLRSELATAAGR